MHEFLSISIDILASFFDPKLFRTLNYVKCMISNLFVFSIKVRKLVKHIFNIFTILLTCNNDVLHIKRELDLNLHLFSS